MFNQDCKEIDCFDKNLYNSQKNFDIEKNVEELKINNSFDEKNENNSSFENISRNYN